jgi:hypothetical protein
MRRAVGVVAGLVVALALSLSLASCKACNEERSTGAAAESLPPPPSSLLLEGTFRDADALWTQLRSDAGGHLLMMPPTAAGLVLDRARIDPRVANLVARGLPFHVAVGEGDGGGFAFAIAMPVRDLRAAEGALGKWGARDAGTGPGPGGLELLHPLLGLNAPEVALALFPSGYLVLASSGADLAALGPYAATTLPTKPPPRSALELRVAPGALAQAGVKATNLGAWATSNLLGLLKRIAPPAFDANVFAACVNPLLVSQAAMIADLESAKLELDTGSGEIHAVATLTPKPGDNAARRRLLAMHPADAAPLLDAPGAATYAVFFSDAAAQRIDDVTAIAPCLEHALSAPLGEAGAATLDGVLAAWAKGRGDWDTIAEVGGGFAFRAPVADADSASRALHDLTDLVGHPPISDVVQQTFGLLPGTVQQADVPPFGAVTTLAFDRQPMHAAKGKGDHAAPPRPPLGLAWAVGAGEIDLGVGESPKDVLATTRAAPKLGADVATAQAVQALAKDATFAAVLKPFDCCKTGGPASTPLTFGWGRHGDAGWSRVEMGYGLLLTLVGN